MITLVSREIDDDEIVETYERLDEPGVSSHVVRYAKPAPRIVLSVDRRQILADGVDEALVTATFESWSLVDGDGVWSSDVPTGDVTFVINLRPTTVSIDAEGKALLALSTTVAGRYSIVASLTDYGEARADVEAML